MIFFLLISSTLAFATGPVFSTNLDKPKAVIVQRDSMNYRLSDSMIKALAEINKGKATKDQIKLFSYGKSFTEEEYLANQEDGPTSRLPRLPMTPFEDLYEQNRPFANYSWYQHTYQPITQWLQDELEFFYRGGRLHVLELRQIFRPDEELAAEEKAEIKALGERIDNETLTDEEMDRLYAQIEAISARGKTRVQARESELFQKLGAVGKESAGNSHDGGDFEFLPGNVLVTNWLKNTDEPTEFKKWIKGSVYDGRILDLDVNWLGVGHADEIMAVVPARNSCGFALLTMDPELGLELLRNGQKVPAEQLIPEEYQYSSPPGGGMLETSFEVLYRYILFQERNSWSNVDEVIADQKTAKTRIEATLANLKKNYARLVPICKDIPIIHLPVLLECYDHGAKLRDCKSMVANPVNSLVLGQDILVGDPYLPTFRAEIEKRLKANGLRPHFVDTGFYHMLQGEVHCATNVVREKH